MRRLTFQGYLRDYVQHLTEAETVSVSKLLAHAEARPRLVEPLVLFAVVTGRAQKLSTLLRHQPELRADVLRLDALAKQGELETYLGSEDPDLRDEYAKVWRSYLVRRDAGERDTELKLVARERALQLAREKRVSRYRMAKDLGLNPGNLHAFLGQANASKLSLQRAYELVDYLQAA